MCIRDRLGADRIELNHALELGGLTPSLGTFLEAKRQVSLPICVMIRPRGAGFDYTERQFQAMLKDAELFIEHGADGLVFGFLNEDGSINEERTCQMVKAARGKEAIFHKDVYKRQARASCIRCRSPVDSVDAARSKVR